MEGSLGNSRKKIPLRFSYMVIALGVVYGDIGTSPLYVMKSVVNGNGGLSSLSDDFIIGSLSLIIWTVTLITTIKYVIVALKADNKGEGGIFALYSLVKTRGRWLVIPAMIGGATLLADGVLTPAVTVTSAVEGLDGIPFFSNLIKGRSIIIVGIVVVIISALFLLQRAGTSIIGRAFGPVMFIWFSFLAIMGIMAIGISPKVLLALNPLRGVEVLFSPYNKAGFQILGSVFLATTGAEALYSDLGHVGKYNIYGSWPYVKICLLLNYLGQGAWLMEARLHAGNYPADMNPFYSMIPDSLRLFAVVLSTLAAIIASQALITGSYTLVSEAIHLGLMPHLQIQYPSETKGQMYIPMVNNLLWLCCLGVILLFRSSNRMEAAYGLAITVTMLMTTILLSQYLRTKNVLRTITTMFTIAFLTLESSFFIFSVVKFIHGGYVTVILASLILLLMLIWYLGSVIEKKQEKLYPASYFVVQLNRLRADTRVPYMAANLVFMTVNGDMEYLERDVLYSILDKRPKRAQVYWFIHINVADDPYTMEYSVQNFGTDYCFKVKLRLGFKVEQRVNVFMRQIVRDLIKSGELKPQMQGYSIYEGADVGDFEFVFIKKTLAPDSNISGKKRAVIRAKYAVNNFTGSPVRWFGLENARTIVESVPLFIMRDKAPRLKRTDWRK